MMISRFLKIGCRILIGDCTNWQAKSQIKARAYIFKRLHQHVMLNAENYLGKTVMKQ